MIIHPYKLGSRSAKRLKDAVNGSEDTRLAYVLTREPRSTNALVINWGASEMKYQPLRRFIVNDPKIVYMMSSKTDFFRHVGHDEDFLSWSCDPSVAAAWPGKVFARQLTRASGGRGIVVWSRELGVPLPPAPLYTMHQPKTAEYRLHMARSLEGTEFTPILIQRKVFMKKEGVEAPKDWDVRNHDNGFIFQSHPDVSKIPAAVLDVAQRGMKHFADLHFVALDILFHSTTGKAKIVEGNTAPGLENATVDVYAHYFRGLNEEYQAMRKYPSV